MSRASVLRCSCCRLLSFEMRRRPRTRLRSQIRKRAMLRPASMDGQVSLMLVVRLIVCSAITQNISYLQCITYPSSSASWLVAFPENEKRQGLILARARSTRLSIRRTNILVIRQSSSMIDVLWLCKSEGVLRTFPKLACTHPPIIAHLTSAFGRAHPGRCTSS